MGPYGYWTHGAYFGFVPKIGYMQFVNEEEYIEYLQDSESA